jgi:nucleotide-binding universal stress UspA family protein
VKGHGSVAGVIVETAESKQCDLVIMGGYGFDPVMEIALGSQVDEVLRTSRLPILICR